MHDSDGIYQKPKVLTKKQFKKKVCIYQFLHVVKERETFT